GAPAFRVTIPSSAACTSDVPLDLALSSGGADTNLALALPVGRKLSTDVPQLIDNGAVDSTLSFGGTGPVQNLQVRMARLNHTWVGDLVVTLRSPSGTTVTL